MKIPVVCPCGKLFEVAPSKIPQGRGKHCSPRCSYQYRPRQAKRGPYNIRKVNPGWFKPGNVPANATPKE